MPVLSGRFGFFPKLSVELQEIFVNRVLETLAFSLISLFIPSYLYSLGYSLNESISYLFFFYGAMLVAVFASGIIYKRFGTNLNVLLSVFFYLSHFYILFNFESGNWPVWLLGVLMGVGHAMYWVAINSDFVVHERKRDAGRDTALLFMMPKLAVLLSPLVGAYVLTLFGIQNLIYVVAVLLLLSVLPFFATATYKPKQPFKISRIFQDKDARYWHSSLVDGMVHAGIWIWTLHSFIVLSGAGEAGFEGVGLVGSLFALGGLTFSFGVGWFEDKFGDRSVLKTGSVLNFFAWTLGAFALTPLFIYGLTVFRSFSNLTFQVTLFKEFGSFAKTSNAIEAISFREVVLCIGRIAVFSLFFLLPDDFKFVGAFVFIGLASLSLWFYKTDN